MSINTPVNDILDKILRTETITSELNKNVQIVKAFPSPSLSSLLPKSSP